MKINRFKLTALFLTLGISAACWPLTLTEVSGDPTSSRVYFTSVDSKVTGVNGDGTVNYQVTFSTTNTFCNVGIWVGSSFTSMTASATGFSGAYFTFTAASGTTIKLQDFGGAFYYDEYDGTTP